MAYPLVPVPGTGDNGYRPNFTTPSPDEVRQARLRGAPLSPEQARAYDSSPEGRSTSRQYNQARFERAGGGTRVPPVATPTVPPAAPAAQPAQPARGALRGAVDAVTKFGSKTAATAGAVGGALRVVGGPAMMALEPRTLANGELPPEIKQMYENGAPYNGTKSLSYMAMMPEGSAAREELYGKAPTRPPVKAPNTVAPNPVNTGAPRQQGAAAAPGMTGNVTRNGNEYSGTNIGGDITINGFEPGAGLNRGSIISPQNMAAADGLAAQQERASLGRVAGAQQPQQPLRQFSAPTAVHSGNDWTARQRLRSLEMRADGIHRTGKERRLAQAAYLEALRADAASMMSQPTLAIENNKTNASLHNARTQAQASMYGADSDLYGQIYKADSAEREAGITARAAAETKRQERAGKNWEANSKRFTVYNDDGSVNQQATQAAIERAEVAFPGILNQDPSDFSQNAGAVFADTRLMGNYVKHSNADVRPTTMPDVRGQQLRVGNWVDSITARLPFVNDAGVRSGQTYTRDPVTGKVINFGELDEGMHANLRQMTGY